MASQQPNQNSMNNHNFRGVPFTDIPNLLQQADIFGDMKDVHDPNHTFMIKPFKYDSTSPDAEPEPFYGTDSYLAIWDDVHVRLPCSQYNITNDKTLRWFIIEETLTRLKQKCEEHRVTVHEIHKAIETCNDIKMEIGCLEQLLTQIYSEQERGYFMSITLPKIISLALDVGKICNPPPPLLRINSNRSVTMSQRQVASLLACAFFCLFPLQIHEKTNNTHPTYQSVNFNRLFKSGAPWKIEKLKCILHYFRRVTENMPRGVITFQRFALPDDCQPQWMQSQTPLCPLHIAESATIEDKHGLLQVDFANEFIGGGVMDEGIVQEEIRFTICTEMLVSVLLCEVMFPNECIFLIGCEQFTSYAGYADTFQAKSDFIDSTPKDSWGRKLSHVVAMDAICYSNPIDQFHVNSIGREIHKAYTCFRIPTALKQSMFGVATGNWGCGAFNGNRELKAIIQLTAASQAGRPLAYVTWHDKGLASSLWCIYEYLANQKATVKDLCMYLKQYSKCFHQMTLFKFILTTPVSSLMNN